MVTLDLVVSLLLDVAILFEILLTVVEHGLKGGVFEFELVDKLGLTHSKK